MSAEQQRIFNEIAGPRHGHVRGPFALWMRTPAIADAANRLGNVLRTGSTFEKPLFELMVLVVARHWGAQYEWFAHAKQAITAGLGTATIEAIRHGRRPAFKQDDEGLIYDATQDILTARALSQHSYGRMVETFGVERTIEFVSAVGFYVMVAIMLNSFDAPVPDGSKPLPPLPSS